MRDAGRRGLQALRFHRDLPRDDARPGGARPQHGATAAPPALDLPAAQPLLRRTLTAYEAAFSALAAHSGWALRPVTGQLLAHHVRRSTSELESALHVQIATGRATDAQEPLLSDLRHYRASLRPPLSSFSRAVLAILVVLTAQMIGRVSLVPRIASTEAEGDHLRPLNEALDLDPGHIAKALGDVLGSSTSTKCSVVATVAAALTVTLLPWLPSALRTRQLIRGRARRPEGDSIADLEQKLFAELGCIRTPRRPLGFWWLLALAVVCLSLGVAWYLAYFRGVLYTPEQALALTDYPTGVASTVRPLRLGTIGSALTLVGGVLLVYALLREIGALPRVVRALRRLPRAVLAALVLIAGAVVVWGGTSASSAWPSKSREERAPFLFARATPVRIARLATEPVVPLLLRCRPGPCTVEQVQLASPTLIVGGDEVGLSTDVTNITWAGDRKSINELPTEVSGADKVRDRVGERASPVPRDLPKTFRRFAVKGPQLVSADDKDFARPKRDTPLEDDATRLLAHLMARFPQLRASDPYSPDHIHEQLLGVVLSDAALSDLIAKIDALRSTGRQAPEARIDDPGLTVIALDMTVRVTTGSRHHLRMRLPIA